MNDNSLTERTAVLYDQHPLWLDAVEAVMTRISVKVIGKATLPETALELVEQLQPDIFITGTEKSSASTLDGTTLIRRAREVAPELRTVALSTNDDPAHIGAVLAAGATAFVVKTSHPDDLAAAV